MKVTFSTCAIYTYKGLPALARLRLKHARNIDASATKVPASQKHGDDGNHFPQPISNAADGI